MKKLLFISLVLLSSLSLLAQEEYRVLELVNSERPKNRQLEYLPSQQLILTSVASQLPGSYGHYYGGPYDGEVLTRAISLENSVKMFWNSPRHKAILNSRNAKYATVGIFKAEFAYYVIIRTYNKKP